MCSLLLIYCHALCVFVSGRSLCNRTATSVVASLSQSALNFLSSKTHLQLFASALWWDTNTLYYEACGPQARLQTQNWQQLKLSLTFFCKNYLTSQELQAVLLLHLACLVGQLIAKGPHPSVSWSLFWACVLWGQLKLLFCMSKDELG